MAVGSFANDHESLISSRNFSNGEKNSEFTLHYRYTKWKRNVKCRKLIETPSFFIFITVNVFAILMVCSILKERECFFDTLDIYKDLF